MPDAPRHRSGWQAYRDSKERQDIWELQCGAPRCPYRRKNGMKLSILRAADTHAFKKPGHNVIVSYWTPDGSVLYRVVQHSVQTTLDDSVPPF